MDWIKSRSAVGTKTEFEVSGVNGKKRTRKATGQSLPKQLSALLAQPDQVIATGFESLSKLHWPKGVSRESSFLWSTVMQEQAEVLVRAGMPPQKLSAIVAENRSDSELSSPDDDFVRNDVGYDELSFNHSVGSNGSLAPGGLREVLGMMQVPLEKAAFDWLAQANSQAKAALGVSAITWYFAELIRQPGNEWLKQWLTSALEHTAGYVADAEECVMCHLVMQCELPLLVGLVAGYGLSKSRKASTLQKAVLEQSSLAMDHLAEHLEQSEDQPAPWLAYGATYLRASLAVVVRCRVLADALNLRDWYAPQQKAIAELLKHAARWSRPDGTALLAAGHNSPRSKAVWTALIKQTRQPKAMRNAMAASGLSNAAAKVAGGEKNGKPARSTTVESLNFPPLTYYCDNAGNACMQSDWKKKGSRFAIDFSDTEVCIEALGPKGFPLLAGEWLASVEHEGQSQLQLDAWQEVCWFSDDDVDYLELEVKFGQHARVQRQAVLLRDERLLLLADALLSEQPGAWSLSSRIPLAAETRFEPAGKTTEGFLVNPVGARCLALPLHMPEWRRQITTSGFDVEDGELVASQHGTACRQYVATLLSLCNSHAKKPFTWRKLTIGEDLRIVDSSEAVAYRVQIAKEQWLIYRSLAQAKRRTAIGMHTLADFLIGRMDAEDGQIDTIVMVEAATV